MYNTTTTLAAALATQKLYTKVVYGSTTIGAEQVKKCVYSGSFGGAATVTIGGVTAAMVTLTLSGAHNLRDKTITVSIGADVSGTVQYVPLGTFVVATCKQVDDTTTVTAYDAAYYALGGTYTPTVSSGATVAAVLSDVATQCGLTLATLPSAASTTSVVGDLTGKTCRDMVGYLAALMGCNALIDRDGKLALRWFASSGQSYSPSDYYNAGLSIDGTSTQACIQAEVETTTTDGDGNTSVHTDTYTAGGTGVGISIQNPYMTQAILDTVWASIGGLAYTVGSCDIFHGLLTEPGDLVTITDKAGVAHTLAVMSLELSIDGGCRAKIQATADSATDTGANVTGSMTKQITKIAKDVTEFYTIVAQKAKVTDLEAANAEISSLKTEKANVADLNATTGRIDDLEADTASLGQAVAEKASIADLNAVNAEIDTLKTGKANVTDLTAATGRIDALETENASVKELVASKADVKDLTAATGRIDSLETGKADVDLLNVAKATIENLLVRGGIITDSLTGVEINATKFLTGVTIIGDVIKAGTLAANRIILTGENGLIYELNVNAGNLTASQLTEEQYKQALDGSVLVASSITTDKLAAGSVTAQVIASGAVTTDKLEVGAVKAKHIDVDDLFAQNITATGAITGAKLNGAELDCSRTEGSKNYTCAMKNGKVEAAYQDNLLDGGDKERYTVTVNKDAATALEIEHIYDSATNGVSKQRTIVDADSIRVGDKSTGNNYNSPLDTKGMYVKRDGLYAWDYLNLKVGDILNEYVSLLRYASCDTQDADKEKLILGDKAAGVRVWGNEDFSTLDDASAILANTKWVTDKLAAVLADYALVSDIPTKLPANGGHANSADSASKLSGLSAGNRWGNIPKIGADGVMEVGKYLDFHSSDNADKKDYDVRVTCEGDSLTIPKLASDKITDNSYSTNTYTSFSGSVLSSGSVTVTKKLGVCYISGSITASKSITDWTTILTSSQVPAPQHGKMIPFNVPAWGSSYTAALRGRIPASGGLQIRLGAAREYVFEISYPIN